MTQDVKNLGKVAVLMGGVSAEREVSLMSGQGVLQALCSRGVDAHAFDTAQRPLSELQQHGFTRCFIALHGLHGEDGAVQGALEMLGIAYTGSGIMASSIAMDKVMTKLVWQAHGLSTPRSVCWTRESGCSESFTQHLIAELGLPLIVKPVHEGSSIGVSKVSQAEQLEPALRLAAQYGSQVLCEEFIEGQEITCALLGSGEQVQALPVVRIEAPQGKYDYQNKYFTDEVKYHCPSGLSQRLEQEAQQMAVQAYRALGCRGWGRADLMVRERDQQAFLLEMNTSPGMTSHSLVPMAARAAGIDYPDLCVQVLSMASLDTAVMAQKKASASVSEEMRG